MGLKWGGRDPKSLHCVLTSIPWQLALKFVLNVQTYKHTKLSPVALYTHAELRHKLFQLLSYSKNVSNGIVPTLAAEGIWSTCSSSLWTYRGSKLYPLEVHSFWVKFVKQSRTSNPMCVCVSKHGQTNTHCRGKKLFPLQATWVNLPWDDRRAT